MKTVRILALALAVACAASWTLCAWAADTPAAAPGNSAPAAKEKVKDEAKTKVRSEVKCVVTGKLEEKKVTNKAGKEGKVFEIVVATAKSEDGKAMDELTGKTLRVARKTNIKLADFVGKEVTISGTLVGKKRLEAMTIK